MPLIVPASGRGYEAAAQFVKLPRAATGGGSDCPSGRKIDRSCVPNRCSQLSRIFSKTGRASATELLMTCSTSALAVCCSSAAWVSSNSRALCSAIAACRDRPCRNARSRASKGLPPLRHTAVAPSTRRSPASSGTTISRSSLRVSVPGSCRARGSAAERLTNSAWPLRSRLPMMPWPGSIVAAFSSAARSPSATIAR